MPSIFFIVVIVLYSLCIDAAYGAAFLHSLSVYMQRKRSTLRENQKEN